MFANFPFKQSSLFKFQGSQPVNDCAQVFPARRQPPLSTLFLLKVIARFGMEGVTALVLPFKPCHYSDFSRVHWQLQSAPFAVKVWIGETLTTSRCQCRDELPGLLFHYELVIANLIYVPLAVRSLILQVRVKQSR